MTKSDDTLVENFIKIYNIRPYLSVFLNLSDKMSILEAVFILKLGKNRKIF
jgi:hypothetical protein